jgi:prepilin-type N-terminal cleavage/methylation domain-containing protein
MRPHVTLPARPRRAFVLSGPRERRTGFTLVEIVVVLVLLGLAATLVAPALLFPPDGPAPSLAEVIRQGREAAVARGTPLLLQVDGDNHWALLSPAGDTPVPLARGVLDDTTRAVFTIRLTPTGLCAPVPQGGSRVAVDPLDCGILLP